MAVLLEHAKSSASWDAFFLPPAGAVLGAAGLVTREQPGGTALAVVQPAGGRNWVLLETPAGRSRVSVGGLPFAGIRLLRHGSVVAVRGTRSYELWFSDEQIHLPAIVKPSDRAGHCARCKSALEPGEEIIVCGGCAARVHHSEKIPCWKGQSVAFKQCPNCERAVEIELSWAPY